MMRYAVANVSYAIGDRTTIGFLSIGYTLILAEANV
jgi:hypothetical protein